MSNESNTAFADTFFQVPRRVTHFTLGNNPERIFEHFNDLGLHADEYISFHEATGIEIRYPRRWRIGIANQPVVICNQLYPKHTVAMFQGKTPNSRFAVFNVDYMDDELLSSYLSMPCDDESDKDSCTNDPSDDNNEPPINNDNQQQSQDCELRERLEEFVGNSRPKTSGNDKNHPFHYIMNEYMGLAIVAYGRAKLALERQDHWAAYWHAVHAMSAYAAAHTVLEYSDEQTAYANATYVYYNTLPRINEDYPDLYYAFATRPSK
jgi:hypothetical protein